MLSYIKTKYTAGQIVTITCTQGAITGAIEFVNPNFIVLRKDDGTTAGIAAADVRSFSSQAPQTNTPYVDQTDKAFTPHATATPTDDADETPEDVATTNVEANITPETLPETETLPEAEALPEAEQPEATTASIASHIAPETAAEVEGVIKCKVVGSIPLDHLQRIDPKLKKRNYFKSEAVTTEADENNERGEAEPTAAHPQPTQPSKDYVAAMGRISHYNPDKKFGFIHDFEQDIDLYFNIQQIVDKQLYDQLYKGTKVAYTIDANPKGHIARCIHLPGTVQKLIPLADELLDAHRMLPAKNLLKQILAVAPANAEAQTLLNEVEDILASNAHYTAKNTANTAGNTAGQQPEFYSTLYAQAKKAYLAKDTDTAIALYRKALEAGEREESCIKDLVTLYVSLFKQATNPEKREALRRQAQEFIDAHIDRLPQNLTTQQFLALNFYLPLNDYENLIRIVEEIMTNDAIKESPSKLAFFLWQKASALSRLGRKDEALAIIDEGLNLVPRHNQLNRLRYIILHPRHDDAEKEEAAAEASAAEGHTPDAPAEEAQESPIEEATAETPARVATTEETASAAEEEETPAAEPDLALEEATKLLEGEGTNE